MSESTHTVIKPAHCRKQCCTSGRSPNTQAPIIGPASSSSEIPRLHRHELIRCAASDLRDGHGCCAHERRVALAEVNRGQIAVEESQNLFSRIELQDFPKPGPDDRRES